MFGIAGNNRKPRERSQEPWEYRIHDGAAQFRFELRGCLASESVAELEQCWRTAASTLRGKDWIVDASALTGIGPSGRDLLHRWRVAGAQFVAGAESRALLADTIGPVATPPTQPRTARLMPFSLQAALPWLVALFTLLVPASLFADDSVLNTSAAESAGPNAALARYFAGVDKNRPWGQEDVEIDASLPKLKERGRLHAIRRLLPFGKPQYQVMESDGSRTVKQQVIARYLSAEVESSRLAPSSVSVTPANYQFHYVGSVGDDGQLTYVFAISPRKKREGLIQGVLWIDAHTGTAVRLTGNLVKSPSIFLKRVAVTRETNLRDGVAESRTTHIALDTRLVGRAQLVIHERPCSDCTEVADSGAN